MILRHVNAILPNVLKESLDVVSPTHILYVDI